jgi:hypothetical protein
MIRSFWHLVMISNATELYCRYPICNIHIPISISLWYLHGIYHLSRWIRHGRHLSRLELSHGVLLESDHWANCPENLAPIIFSESFPAVWVVKLVVRRCAHFLAATLPIRNSHQLQVNGYGSLPINTIFRGMNFHLPAILGFTRGTRVLTPQMMVHQTFHVCRRPMVALMVWWSWSSWNMNMWKKTR